MNKKLIKKGSQKTGSVKEWTLVQNQDYLKRAFLFLERKSLRVMG
jgi:hypothetical protein